MPYAHNGDVDLYYEGFGDPSSPTLLVINGLGSQCVNIKTEWCEKFVAAGFRVIRFDNRDVGLSSKLDHQYALADMAADAVAVLDDAGVEAAHVMGTSMGGMIAQELAISHSGRLLSLTSVMSTTGDPDVGQSSEGALALLTTPGPPGRDGYVERQLEAARTWGSPACYDETRLRANAEAAYDRCFCPEGQGRQFLAIAGAPSRSDRLRLVNLPALVLHGDQDRLIDISGGRRTAEVIPGARFVVMEGMGHDYPPQYWDTWVGHVAALAGLGRR